jgi:hypothetical protein
MIYFNPLVHWEIARVMKYDFFGMMIYAQNKYYLRGAKSK